VVLNGAILMVDVLLDRWWIIFHNLC